MLGFGSHWFHEGWRESEPVGIARRGRTAAGTSAASIKRRISLLIVIRGTPPRPGQSAAMSPRPATARVRVQASDRLSRSMQKHASISVASSHRVGDTVPRSNLKRTSCPLLTRPEISCGLFGSSKKLQTSPNLGIDLVFLNGRQDPLDSRIEGTTRLKPFVLQYKSSSWSCTCLVA